jgi:hypothetical protein
MSGVEDLKAKFMDCPLDRHFTSVIEYERHKNAVAHKDLISLPCNCQAFDDKSGRVRILEATTSLLSLLFLSSIGRSYCISGPDEWGRGNQAAYELKSVVE